MWKIRKVWNNNNNNNNNNNRTIPVISNQGDKVRNENDCEKKFIDRKPMLILLE